MSDQNKEINGEMSERSPAGSEESRSPPPDHRDLFESSSIGIWEEDWSRIKDMIDQLGKQGVTDWYRYFTLHEDQSDRAYRLASVTDINQAALDIYRAPSKQAVIDMIFVDVIPPEELLDFKNNLVAFIEGRTSYEIESKELTFDDCEISTRRKITIPPDHQTNWSRVLFTIEDITARKRMEGSLRESEARYREIFDDAVAALRVEDWSPVKQMIDGLTNEGVIDLRAYFAAHRDRAAEAYDLAEMLEISNASLDLYGATSAQQIADSHKGNIVPPEEVDAFIEILIGFVEGRWNQDIESWDAKVDGTSIMLRTRCVVPPAHRLDWSRVIYSLEDITEQNRAAMALHESEAHLSNLAANIPGVVYQRLLEPDGTISFPYVSTGVSDIHGFEAEEIMHDPRVLLDSIHPDYLEAFQASLEHSAKTLEPTSLDYELVGKSGDRRWVQASARPHRLESGAVLWDGILLDITEQKRAEAALRKSEILLAEAQRIAHVGNWERSPETDNLYWSDEVFRIFGFEVDAIDPTAQKFAALLHPDDRKATLDAIERALHEGAPYDREYRIVRPDGAVRDIHSLGQVSTDGPGKPIRMVGTIQDITERHQAEKHIRNREKRLTLITENLPGLIAVFDREERVQFANQTYAEWPRRRWSARRWRKFSGPRITRIFATMLRAPFPENGLATSVSSLIRTVLNAPSMRLTYPNLTKIRPSARSICSCRTSASDDAKRSNCAKP